MSQLITVNVAREIIAHEAIVREAYKDSVGVWTWSVGITNATGHEVFPRYKDNPQSLEKCIEVYIWVLGKKYLPVVERTFEGFNLSEEQVAAALSFHYNTGSIHKATWVKEWKDGKVDDARKSIMNWKKPPEIIPRRKKERNLFFDGEWSNNGEAVEYKVRKPSYSPDWGSAKKVNIDSALEELLG